MNRMNTYIQAKAKWQNIKPIRGRAVDIRPIGKRSRSWEAIVQVDLGADKPEGERYAYAARLHSTNVVTWYPDSTMGIKVDTYHTPITAKFIHEVSPLCCCKTNRKLWVCSYGTGSESIKYPVPYKDELRMRRQDDGAWAPLEGYAPKVRRTDRNVTKPLQQQVAPFLNWAKAFLSMADGAIQPETYAQVLEVKVTKYGNELHGWERTELKLPADVAQRLGIADTNDTNVFMLVNNKGEKALKAVLSLTDDDYLPFLCFISLASSSFQASPAADKVIHPVHVNYGKLKEWVYKLIRNAPQSSMEVDFTPSAKVSRNIV
jgi:hypothetical protein